MYGVCVVDLGGARFARCGVRCVVMVGVGGFTSECIGIWSGSVGYSNQRFLL